MSPGCASKPQEYGHERQDARHGQTCPSVTCSARPPLEPSHVACWPPWSVVWPPRKVVGHHQTWCRVMPGGPRGSPSAAAPSSRRARRGAAVSRPPPPARAPSQAAVLGCLCLGCVLGCDRALVAEQRSPRWAAVPPPSLPEALMLMLCVPPPRKHSADRKLSAGCNGFRRRVVHATVAACRDTTHHIVAHYLRLCLTVTTGPCPSARRGRAPRSAGWWVGRRGPGWAARVVPADAFSGSPMPCLQASHHPPACYTPWLMHHFWLTS